MSVASCPNCGNSDLRTTNVKAVGGYGPNLLPGAGGFFRPASFNVVVCCNCGLARFFVTPEEMEKIANSALWDHVTG